jgi:hypothetical protein
LALSSFYFWIWKLILNCSQTTIAQTTWFKKRKYLFKWRIKSQTQKRVQHKKEFFFSKYFIFSKKKIILTIYIQSGRKK